MGDGLCPRKAAASLEWDCGRVIDGEVVVDREGGSEFRSGAIAALLSGEE